MKKLVSLIVLFLFISNSANAFFETDIKKLTMQSGLAENTVSAIEKDNEGFIWFGTDNGLSRYDGKRIHNYFIDNARTNISVLVNGANNFLWTVTNGLLFCFDRSSEKFIQPKTEIQLQAIEKLLIFNDSTLWLVASNKIYQFTINYEGRQPVLIHKGTYDVVNGESRKFISLCISEEGNAITSTYKGELVQIDPIAETASIIDTVSELAGINIHDLYYDNNKVWISTWTKGVFIFDLENKKSIQYSYNADSSKSISHTDVYGITKIDNNRFVAVSWNGYTVFTPEKADGMSYRTKIYNNAASHIHRNLETHMLTPYYDSSGILWIGTFGGGVFASDLKKQFYKQYYQDRHNEICAIAHNDENEVFLGTFHKGLMRSTSKLSPSSEIDFKRVNIPELTENILAMKQNKNDLWIGGEKPVLICYNTITNSYKTYLPNANKRILYGSIRSILVTDDNTIWIGADNLVRFDVHKKEFIQYELPFSYIRAMQQDKTGMLWIASAQGLVKLDPETGQHQMEYENKQNIPARIAKTLIISSDNKVYTGYDNGLSIFSIEADSITNYYSTHNGLNNNYIGAIVEDSNKQIWTGSNSGISRYDKNQNIFYHYYVSSSNRSAMLYNNMLYWGNNINLTYFNPNNLKFNNTSKDKVIITKLEVNNQEVAVGEKINNQVVLSESIFLQDTIVLENVNNSFSISFSNLRYDDIQKYKYRLIPHNENWLVAEEGQDISYSFLEKGEYLFEVKSILDHGDESALTQIYINILPKWYETVWFRLLTLLTTILLIVLILKKLQKINLRKTQERALKEELLIASIENEREKKINEERSIFFTNVSHELRTPLTLIKGPLETIINRDDIPSDINRELNRIYTNALSLSNIVDRLLYLQKSEAGFVKLQVRETDIVNLISQVMASFNQLAEQRHLSFTMHSFASNLNMWIDGEKIESVLKNLISNAFKYTQAEGSVVVSIDKKEIDNSTYCTISISDTGMGIDEKLHSRIFDSFVVGANPPIFSTQIGIGLRIVKNIIDLHHGQIALESQVNKGTTFTILLPVGNAFYDTQEITNDNTTNRQSVNKHTTTLPTTNVENHATNKSKILIIEDNDEIRQYLVDIFSLHFHTIVATNGTEGIEKALSELPDIILTDIMMPDTTGYEVTKELKSKEQTAHIPILALTAKTLDSDIIEGLNIGVDDYIKKPFNPQILRIKVQNLIQTRQQLKRLYTKSLLFKEEMVDSDGDAFMQRIINVIELNISNSEFSVQELAQGLNMSQSTLYRRIKEHSNLSAKDIIRNIRIAKAAVLIMKKEFQIQEVANSVGYNDLSSFRKHFINQFGVNPSDFN